MELKQKASSTGFRVLFLLDLLLKAPLTKTDMVNELSKNPYVSNVSKETVRLDLNTLKSAGFEIQNLGRGKDYKYKINWSPIKFGITKKELRVLSRTKDAVIKLSDPFYIIKLYKLFEKISKAVEDENAVFELLNFRYFLEVDLQILNELYALTNRKKTVLLLYNSPNSSTKEIPVKLKEIKYTGSKLHLIGTSEKYPDNTVLRVDNIVKIIKILSKKEEKELFQKKGVRKTSYRINKECKNTMNLLLEEKIIKETFSYIETEVKSDNDFMVIQRLLSFGEDLISIKNKDIKEKYLNMLQNMYEIYNKNKGV
ncbi:MAG: WYL domain-containing protein [Candidatus Gastranaerophilales bacterium]|nr:WYL domain-containing protein [Candidatus Gastranaerophilales bacterium]